MYSNALRAQVQSLRRNGLTYLEILRQLKVHIPKSTLCTWCAEIRLSEEARVRIDTLSSQNLYRGRTLAAANRLRRRKVKLKSIGDESDSVRQLLARDILVQKIALVMLYLGEGSKADYRSSVMFGNSNAGIVRLFMQLLRLVYRIEEEKFRITVQCRADQDIKVLQSFWSKCTGVPLNQFYRAQIDRRTVGKPTKNVDYKGVCRIDYFSANIDFELRAIAKELEKM